MLQLIKDLNEVHKLRSRINTLELEKEVLEDTIKSELYKEFMAKLGEPEETQRLKEENKKLREDRRTLRRMLKEME